MYDSGLKYKWDNKNVLDYTVKEAREKGFREGFTEGFRKGKKEGIEEGKLKTATTIATALKKEGLSTTQIAKYTNLSTEEIEKL